MARHLFTLLLVVTLLVASTTADSCLGTPAVTGLLAEGATCGGALPCAQGLACDLTSTCSAVKVGDTCLDDLGCPFQSSCNGPDGGKKCIAYAGPGDKCSTDSTQLNATCQAAGCTGGICLGDIGDGCKVDTDCDSTHCNGGTCRSLCGTSNYCTHNQYCDSGTQKCVTWPGTGDCMLGNCGPNAECAYTDLTETKQHCVKYYSVANGGFCTDSGNCVSGLCWRNKCQAKSPDACNLDSPSWTGCAMGEVCTCNNGYLITGYGTCKTENCWDSFYKLELCMWTNCNTWSFGSPKYCYNQFCNQEYTDYNTCDPSNVLWSIYS